MPRLGPRLGKQVKSLATTLTTLQRIDAEKVRRLAFGESTEVDGVMLAPEDVHVEMQPFGEGELVATAGKLVVSIDTHVTEEVRLEGIARDVVNRIQRDRKEIDLSVDQRIDIGAGSANELTLSAISENRAFVENETLSRVTVVPSNEVPAWQRGSRLGTRACVRARHRWGAGLDCVAASGEGVISS
jgi:isoleucyl-tRNA synthetase